MSLLVPGVPQAAALAKLPDLVVASVSSGPAAVERGASFTVTVKVKNAGQAVAPTSITRFYLSVDRHRDKGDSRLSTTRRIPELAVGRTSSGKAKLTIPSSTLDGAYYLLACADDTKLVKERTEDNCRSSKTQMEVIAEATTEELIEADVEAGEITAEQGLVYEVFAAFGDTRLPNKYEGDDAGVVDSLVMAEVAGAFDTLPPEHQAAVIPFIRSPAYPGTWEELPTASPSHRSPNRLERTRAARSADPPPMHPSPLGEEGWWFYEHQRARIWFRPDDVGTEEAADPIFESIAEVWTDLTELMGRTPPSDEGPHEFTNPQGVKETWGDGGSGSLDIYISRMAPYLGGLTVPYPPGCTERPSFIILDPSTTQRGDTWVRAVLAHEFMHTLQVAYKKAGTCEDHRSWDESVADWAMDYVYPTDQAEHGNPSFITYPQGPGSLSLWDAAYSGWPFPLYLEHTLGAPTIPAIYAQMATKNVWGAVDAGIPGGLKERWPEFSRYAWNQEPVTPNFKVWDGFDRVPGDGRGGPIPTTPVSLGVGGRAEVKIPVSVRALSRRYDRFSIGDDVVKLTFENGVMGEPGAAVEALVKLEDGTWKPVADWTDEEKVTFCRDRPAEAVTELVIITSNSTFGNLDHVLTGSHNLVGTADCLPVRFAGTFSGTKQGPQESGYSGPTETWTATGITLDRSVATNDANGKPFQGYNVTGGSVTYTISGGSPCSYSGSTTFSLDPQPPQPATGGHLDLEVRPAQGHGRRYEASVLDYDPPAFTATIDCGDGPIPTNWYGLSDWSTGAEYFEARPDGSLVDVYDPPRGNSGDDFRYEWNFTPEFEGG